MATAAMLSRGETLGGYRIDDLVGVGGMAIVYRAEQLSLGRVVALKVLAPALSADAAFRERFRREGRHAAALDHPNVVTIFDSGEAEGRLYLAMRLVEGSTLAHRIAEAAVSPQDAVAILAPIASALDAAHALGLVHRDIKPSNILLDARGTPFLADFGVATRPGPGAEITSTGGFVGSVHYAPPEQIRGAAPSARGDVYALAAVLYQCLTGQVPYPHDGDAAVMHAHLHDPPPRLISRDPGAARVAAVIARGMAKDPAGRYQRAGEMLDELAPAVAALQPGTRQAAPGFAAAVAVARRTRGRPARARRRRAALLVAVAAVAAGVVLATALPGSSPRPNTARRASPLRIGRPAGWRTAAPAALDAAGLASPRSLSLGSSRMTVGVLASTPAVAAGVPPALRARLGPPATRGTTVLAGAPAHRYTWAPRAGAVLAVSVAATSRGEVGAVCTAPAAEIGACLRSLAGARLAAGVRAVAPGPLEAGAPAQAAGALDALDAYWDDIAVGDYAGAFGRLASGTANTGEAGFVANERRAGITEVRFRAGAATRTAGAATISVASLLTRDAQSGCKSWSGRYEMALQRGRWLIGRADISSRPCTA